MSHGKVETYLDAPITPARAPAAPPAPAAAAPDRSPTKSYALPAAAPSMPRAAPPPPPARAPPAAASGPTPGITATGPPNDAFVPAGFPPGHSGYSSAQTGPAPAPAPPLGPAPTGHASEYTQNSYAGGDVHRSGQGLSMQDEGVGEKVMSKVNELLGQAGKYVDQANKMVSR